MNKKKIDIDYIKEELDKVIKTLRPDGVFGYGSLYDIATHFYKLGIEQKDMTELDKFKELPHINSLYEIVDDWGYSPNLYHFDGDWHVTWIHCEDGDGLNDFVGETPEEAINKAYEWFHNKFSND